MATVRPSVRSVVLLVELGSSSVQGVVPGELSCPLAPALLGLVETLELAHVHARGFIRGAKRLFVLFASPPPIVFSSCGVRSLANFSLLEEACISSMWNRVTWSSVEEKVSVVSLTVNGRPLYMDTMQSSKVTLPNDLDLFIIAVCTVMSLVMAMVSLGTSASTTADFRTR
ncbi:Hypothetical predicted protein [Pelobates cultripes]|uniref:Uncharacterized protein n=1 Tax=Pelobates cultripes TaxID=61616 RepID=A0AAD1WSN6_PELCU|nr:Hypothetical predicted protein [Pelobates cultripes]